MGRNFCFYAPHYTYAQYIYYCCESLLGAPLISVCISVQPVHKNAVTMRPSIKLASAAKGEVTNRSNPTNSRIVTSGLFIIYTHQKLISAYQHQSESCPTLERENSSLITTTPVLEPGCGWLCQPQNCRRTAQRKTAAKLPYNPHPFLIS